MSLDLAYTICVFVGVDRTFSGGGGLTVAGGWVFGICCHTHTNTHIYTHIIPTYVGVCVGELEWVYFHSKYPVKR